MFLCLPLAIWLSLVLVSLLSLTKACTSCESVILDVSAHLGNQLFLWVFVGIFVSIIGLVVIIVSFVMNSAIYYNPYKEPETYSSKSIEETFVVPEEAQYNRAYRVFHYKEGKALFNYSKVLFSKHELEDIQFKMEGGYVYQLNGKTMFVVYLYNL